MCSKWKYLIKTRKENLVWVLCVVVLTLGCLKVLPFIDPKPLIALIKTVWILLILCWLVILSRPLIGPLQRLLLRWLADHPAISLTRDMVKLGQTDAPFVCRCGSQLRAYYQLSLPKRELNTASDLSRMWRILLRFPVCAVMVYAHEGQPLRYPIADGTEPQLQKILGFENDRLFYKKSLNPIRCEIALSVTNLDQAKAILVESGGLLRALNYQDVAKHFFGGLYQTSSVVAAPRASGSPGCIELEARFLPLIVTGFAKSYRAQPNRVGGLEKRLSRAVLWLNLSFPFENSELRRMKWMAALESAIPKKAFDPTSRKELEETPYLLEHLEQEIHSEHPPRLVKEIIWVRLRPEDDSAVIRNQARDYLFDLGIQSMDASRTQALRLYCSVYPGLERFSADRHVGLGLTLTETETINELQAVSRWCGTKTPLLIAEDESGLSVPLNLFEGGNNYNLVLTGESGSGKSVLIHGLVCGFLAQSNQNRVVLVDYGGSFSGLVQALAGQYLEKSDVRRTKFNPLPIMEPLLSKTEFQKKCSGAYATYKTEWQERQLNLAKASLTLIKDYLCQTTIENEALFQQAFLTFIQKEVTPNRNLSCTLQHGKRFANGESRRRKSTVHKTAYRDLYRMLSELEALCQTCPFMGDSKFRLTGSRLIAFNLDGFAPDEKRLLLGLITLLIEEDVSQARAGQSMLVFDEVHKFLNGKGGQGLGKMLDSTSRVTRKYGSALVLASQSLILKTIPASSRT